MLRRYLIVNGISTAMMYAAYYALVPSLPLMVDAAWQSFHVVAMESSFFGPLFYRVPTLVGG